jgi:hypothetical protein
MIVKKLFLLFFQKINKMSQQQRCNDFFYFLGNLVAGKVRRIKDEVLDKMSDPSAVTQKRSKDINERFKAVVANLPDDKSYYILLRDRLIWINQHESILRHSSYGDVKKSIYVTMTRNLYELVVAMSEAYNDRPELEILLTTCISLYEGYHEICQNHFGDFGEMKDLSRFMPSRESKSSSDLPQVIVDSIKYVLDESTIPIKHHPSKSCPNKLNTAYSYTSKTDSIWSSRPPTKRSSL